MRETDVKAPDADEQLDSGRGSRWRRFTTRARWGTTVSTVPARRGTDRHSTGLGRCSGDRGRYPVTRGGMLARPAPGHRWTAAPTLATSSQTSWKGGWRVVLRVPPRLSYG
jgi:hypothetical protein